jgi:hypothetical protein
VGGSAAGRSFGEPHQGYRCYINWSARFVSTMLSAAQCRARAADLRALAASEATDPAHRAGLEDWAAEWDTLAERIAVIEAREARMAGEQNTRGVPKESLRD